MKKYIIGEIGFYNDMPIATIIDSKTSEKVGFLSPFRGYKFQISETFEGERDLGSSNVFGLGNVWAMAQPDKNALSSSNINWMETKLEMLKGQVMLSINGFVSKREAIFINHRFNHEYSNGNTYWGFYSLDHFINEVGLWLDKKLNTNQMDSMIK